jgi:DNA-binding winged helix-turn-helix (wHTH) protein
VTYRFARFLVDSDRRQLLADGREVHLSPKAFELLLVLLQHRSRAIAKTELQERLWPSTFVGETNLATLVAEIRRALDESAREPRYLRTMHRFGYWFAAEVTEGASSANRSQHTRQMYVTTADRQFPLAEGPLVIGRAHDADIRIDAGGVSRHHARITVGRDATRVEDLGSKNGTYLNGKPAIGACVLNDGDEIRVGPVTLTFRVSAPTQATETMS